MRDLKARREAAGLTQGELSELSGVAHPDIAAYESGRRMLTERMRTRLEQAMTRPSELVEQHRVDIRELVATHGGHNPRLVGSVARGEDRPGSDVDLVVTFHDDASLFDVARLHSALGDLLGVRVDVIDDAGLRAKHDRILMDMAPL
jgi:predicted nucleotidyltransferase